MSKQKLETSVNVFHRIKSDYELKKNIAHFTLSCWDGIKKKYMDKSVETFKTIDEGGDIPWTRVGFIKYKGKVIWDREARYYDINQCFESVECIPSDFTVMTYNILSDIFASPSEKYLSLSLKNRGENIVSLIEELDCDIVILQEVTNKIKKLLERLKLNIFYTELNGRNDVAIISKVSPISSRVVKFSAKKEAIVNKYQLNENKTVTIVGFHTSSDFFGDSSMTRSRQFNILKKEVNDNNNEIGNTVIFAGDTNELENISQFDHLDRVLSDYTYDPHQNEFANKTSKKKVPTHYDRIYHSKDLNLVSSRVVKSQLSDHFPLIARFTFNEEYVERNYSTLDNKCALVVIPENVIRDGSPFSFSRYNPKWMPHINLFWPFLNMRDINKHMYQLDKVNFKPFTVTLDSYGFFEHESNVTVYMKINDVDLEKMKEIREMYRNILKLIPHVWTPHLSFKTVSKNKYLNSKGEFDIEILKKKMIFGSPITFNISKTFYISRVDTDNMSIKRIFNSSPTVNIETEKKKVVDFFKMFADNVVVSGSDRIYNIFNEWLGSDLDLCCYGPLTAEEFSKEIKTHSGECGLFYDCETITGYMNGLKLRTPYFNVDIHYNEVENDYIPESIIKTIIGKESIFVQYYKDIRKVFEDYNIYGQTFCYFGSIHITMLAAFITNTAKSGESKESGESGKRNLIRTVLEVLNNEQIISPKGDIKHFSKVDPPDNILVMTIDGERNLVRTLNQRSFNTTKDSLLKYLSLEPQYGTPSYSNIFHIVLKSTDKVLLEKKQDKVNSLIRKFVITLNKSGNDARSGNKWTLEEKNGMYLNTFEILYNPNSNMFDHHRENFCDTIAQSLDDYIENEWFVTLNNENRI